MRYNAAVRVKPAVLEKMDRTGSRYKGAVGAVREILPNDWVLVRWPAKPGYAPTATPFNLAELEVINA